MDTQAVLTLTGVAAELSGLGLVVLDVRQARRDARAALIAFEPDQPMTFPVSKSLQIPYDIEGARPPLDERIEALEREVADQRSDYLERINALETQLRE